MFYPIEHLQLLTSTSSSQLSLYNTCCFYLLVKSILDSFSDAFKLPSKTHCYRDITFNPPKRTAWLLLNPARPLSPKMQHFSAVVPNPRDRGMVLGHEGLATSLQEGWPQDRKSRSDHMLRTNSQPFFILSIRGHFRCTVCRSAIYKVWEPLF